MRIAPPDGPAQLLGEYPALAEAQGMRQQLFLRDGGFTLEAMRDGIGQRRLDLLPAFVRRALPGIPWWLIVATLERGDSPRHLAPCARCEPVPPHRPMGVGRDIARLALARHLAQLGLGPRIGDAPASGFFLNVLGSPGVEIDRLRGERSQV